MDTYQRTLFICEFNSLSFAMTTPTRRHFIESCLALAALSNPVASMAQPTTGLATPKRGQKKGLAGGGSGENALGRLNAHWNYNWTATRPAAQPASVEWVPMIFRADAEHPIEKSVAQVRTALPNKPIAVLGFNEPDQDKQANMTVEMALEAWPKIEELNLPLGSPAGVHGDSPWMQSFMKEAMKRKYRIDFVTIHWYGGPNAGQFMTHLEKIAKLYKRPLWITEFCPADWTAGKTGKNNYTQKEVLSFIKDLLPQLERSSFVHRYAWFNSAAGNTPTGCSALFEADGALTKLGEAYAEIG